MAKIVRRSDQGGRIRRRVRVLLGLSLSCGVALSLGAFGLIGTSSALGTQAKANLIRNGGFESPTGPTATGNSGAAIASDIHTYAISALNPTFSDTGLDIPAGSSVSLSVAGNATCHAGGASDCPIGDPSGVYICANNPYYPGEGPGPAGASINYDSLAAKIGKNGQPFVVGTSKTLTDPTGGELYLVFNDCGSAAYVDNAGQDTVTVTVASVFSVTSVTGTEGTPLTLVATGGTGTGAVSFTTVNGTARGCTITGTALTASTAGTCIVTASQAADSTDPAVSSVPTGVTLAAPVSVVKLVTTSVTLAKNVRVLPVQISCPGSKCTGSLSTSASVTVIKRKAGKTISVKETISFGTGSYSLAAGAKGTLSIHLTAASLSYLGGSTRSKTVSVEITDNVGKKHNTIGRVSLLK